MDKDELKKNYSDEGYRYLKLMEVASEIKTLNEWRIKKDINDEAVLNTVNRIECSLNKFIEDAKTQFVFKSECTLLHKMSEDKAVEERANREKLEAKVGQILILSVCSLVGFLIQVILILINKL